jgi:hypothetical protein
VTITFQFANGDSATLDVPVVLDDGQWAGLDVSTPSPSATDSTSPSPSASPSS